MPSLGVAAALERGRSVFVIDVGPEPNPLLSGGDSVRHIPIWQYGLVVQTFIDHGVQDVYLLGKVDPTLMTDARLDEGARSVLTRVKEKAGHAVVSAFIEDMAQHGLRVRPQLELLQPLLVASDFSKGAQRLTAEQQRDIYFGYDTARALTEHLPAGQTVVVKQGLVLALEAAEGTDAAIRRGGALGGPGAVVVKVKGMNRDADLDFPVVGMGTVQAAIEIGAAALVMEADNVILLDREAVVEAAGAAGLALVAVTGANR